MATDKYSTVVADWSSSTATIISWLARSSYLNNFKLRISPANLVFLNLIASIVVAVFPSYRRVVKLVCLCRPHPYLNDGIVTYAVHPSYNRYLLKLDIFRASATVPKMERPMRQARPGHHYAVYCTYYCRVLLSRESGTSFMEHQRTLLEAWKCCTTVLPIFINLQVADVATSFGCNNLYHFQQSSTLQR
jgi:hypothetical protein